MQLLTEMESKKLKKLIKEIEEIQSENNGGVA